LIIAFVLAASVVDINAAERAEGNRIADAVRIGRVLLRTTWPAQVLRIRVDGVGSHTVAGLMLSGVKFHRALDENGFDNEVIELVRLTFASSRVEEVDVWATVPLPYAKQTPVNGEYLRPTDRIVYGATVGRTEASTFAERLLRGDDVFWDARWRRTFGKTAGSGAAQGAARPEAQS
jgi:hypothetical protein